MRRWNGWGEEHTIYPLPDEAARYLERAIGPGRPAQDAALERVMASVPASRLPPHPLITVDTGERLRHARGQSLPDWVALRSGRLSSFPDGIAYPSTDEEVRSLLAYAVKAGGCLIPYGGGTSVVGHINPLPDGAPAATMDLSRMNRLLSLDEDSHLATFEAGVRGPDLESQLAARGFTLGHFPQSFEFSTLGGWIASRSTGQQSYYYGRIEALFAAGHLESPAGPLDLPALPASAAGPDIRHLVLGSEGRLGVITRAIVRVRARPEAESFYGIFFRDWASAAEAVRQLAQSAMPVSMLRLSDPLETETTLALSGRERLIGWANRGLRAFRYGGERCLLILGLTGSRLSVDNTLTWAGPLCRANGGLFPIAAIGRMWAKTRFLAPYLRNTLWERGYALDTVETAVPWVGVLPTAEAVKGAIRSAFESHGEKSLAFSHLSHVYNDGASVYTTFLFRCAPDPDETIEWWRAAKAAASQVIVRHGGTISHQHGVGTDHAPYLEAEKGRLGLAALEAVRRTFDPDGLMNPGKLLGDG
jgi:alkyldihydroxyacetonephosphate synthase